MEIGDILRDHPQTVAERWREAEIALDEKEKAFARAYFRAKEQHPGPKPLSNGDAELKAKLDPEYTKAHLHWLDVEMKHKKISSEQINSRKLAEMMKQGL